MILRFAEGVAAENGEVAAGVAQGDLERIVIRITDSGLARVAAEIRTERAACAVENLACGADVLTVFAEGAARSLAGREVCGIAEHQAQSGVAGIRFGDDEQAMALRADVVDAQDGVGTESALERQHVFLGVGNAIRREVVRQAGDGFELRPVDGCVGMARAGIEWSERDRKCLAEILPGCRSHERLREQRRRGAGIGGAVGSIGAHDAAGERFARGIEPPIASADAGFAGSAQNPGEKTVAGRRRRIGEANAWCRNHDCLARRAFSERRGQWDRGCRRCARENDRLLAGDEGRDLIVFFVPRLDAIPTQAVQLSVKLRFSRQLS